MPYTAGHWQHVSVALIPDAASPTGYREVTSVDGQSLVDRVAHASDPTAPLASCVSALLRIGINEVGFIPNTAVAIVHYDNIIVHERK